MPSGLRQSHTGRYLYRPRRSSAAAGHTVHPPAARFGHGAVLPLPHGAENDRMPWTTKLLVISSRTLGSEALLAHMRARAQHAPTEFTIVVPQGRGADPDHLAAALARFAAQGLAVEIRVGDRDPLLAVRDHWDPKRFDEVVVVTLPTQSSRWLASGLPFRVQQLTGALVTHVVAEPPPGTAREREAAQTPARAGGLHAVHV